MGLATLLVLQILASFYQVLALLLLGTLYRRYLLVRRAATLRRPSVKLAFVVAVVTVAAVLMFAPYLRTRTTSDVLAGQGGTAPLLSPLDYLPGGRASAGSLAFGLAAIILVDRLRRRMPGGRDPRPVLLVAGLGAVTDPRAAERPAARRAAASTDRLERALVPGLDAVRVLPSLRVRGCSWGWTSWRRTAWSRSRPRDQQWPAPKSMPFRAGRSRFGVRTILPLA